MKYKIGDKVKVKSIKWYYDNKNEFGTVKCNGAYFQPIMSKLCENILTIKNINKGVNTYNVIENDYYWDDDMFEGLVEEKTTKLRINGIMFPNEKYADKVELCLGDDYEIVVEDGRTFVQRKKSKYPTTYEECRKVLGIDEEMIVHGGWYKHALIRDFYKLLICRDAYWMIANNWKPDWTDNNDKYFICILKNKLWMSNIRDCNRLLVFPTVEMRDAFYENFKELIEKVKEFL